MPVVESESLVLRSYSLAEADRIVVFFTRFHGVVRGVAKGAKKLKSRFGSGLELFSTVNLTYFQKDDRELVSVQSVEMTRSRFYLASDPAYLNTFSYLVELLISVVPPHDPNEKIYRMTLACLDTEMENGADLSAIELYFELWLLRLGGYLPSWATCGECRRPLSMDEPVRLRSDFHLECDNCRRSSGTAIVSNLQRALLDGAQTRPPSDFLTFASPHSDTVAVLSSRLRKIVNQVIGRDLKMKPAVAIGP